MDEDLVTDDASFSSSRRTINSALFDPLEEAEFVRVRRAHLADVDSAPAAPELDDEDEGPVAVAPMELVEISHDVDDVEAIGTSPSSSLASFFSTHSRAEEEKSALKRRKERLVRVVAPIVPSPSQVRRGWPDGILLDDDGQDRDRDREPPTIPKYRKNVNYLRTTKFGWVLFLPLSLFDQLKRLHNLFFILTMALQLIPSISPIFPVTSILPVLFILGLALLKDAIEEISRYRADRRANYGVRVKVFRRREQILIPSMLETAHINVGEFMLLRRGDVVPADVAVLRTDRPDGAAFVTTANLDGEGNLKRRQAIEEVQLNIHHSSTPEAEEEEEGEVVVVIPIDDDEDDEDIDDVVAETLETVSIEMLLRPNTKSLDEFSGVIRIQHLDQEIIEHILTPSNILLRGSVVRSEAVLAVSAYCGKMTKMHLNLTRSRSKWGALDHKLNFHMLFMLLFHQVMIVASVVASVVLREDGVGTSWYLDRIPVLGSTDPFVFVIASYATFFILYSQLIPMSLIVTLELIRLCQAKLIEQYLKGLICKTFNLTFDLACVDVLFADKTGTLTQNRMEFEKASFGGITVSPSTLRWNQKKENEMFLLNALLNNTVTPSVSVKKKKRKHLKQKKSRSLAQLKKKMKETKTRLEETKEKVSRSRFDGASVDEVCLVEMCADAGCVLLDRTKSRVRFRIESHTHTAEILEVFPFTSERKRMTTVVRLRMEEDDGGGDGRIIAFTKGADSEILGRLGEQESKSVDGYREAVRDFSCSGLRTLCFAHREVSGEELAKLAVSLSYARRMDLEKRQEKKPGKKSGEAAEAEEEHLLSIPAISEKFEKGFILSGVTGIADALQDRVPETIAYLRDCGIRVWVLTGDQVDTARNVCASAGLFRDETKEIVLTGQSYGEDIQRLEFRLQKILEHLDRMLPTASKSSRKDAKKKIADIALVLDSKSLDHLFGKFPAEFASVIRRIDCVVCCRVTPFQKSLVCHVAQKKLKWRGLAVGDGANDVSMIRRSYVGVGVMGREGTQAARASDFAIPRFSMLKNLIAVQGRYGYLRSSECILVSFYKNTILAFSVFMYQFWSRFSGMLLFDSFSVTLYNLVFHALPPVIFGLTEKDLGEDILVDSPKSYKNLQSNPYFGVWRLLHWYILALFHSLVIFWSLFMLVPSWNDVETHAMFGYYAMTLMNVVITLVYAIELRFWTMLAAVFFITTPVLYLGWCFFDGVIPNFFGLHSFYYVPFQAIDHVGIYLYLLLFSVVSVVPTVILRFLARYWGITKVVHQSIVQWRAPGEGKEQSDDAEKVKGE